MRPALPLLCCALLAACLLAGAPGADAEPCPNEAAREAQHSAHLPECRAYEMVSPPAKNGGNVIADPARAQAADDGSAFAFSSLAAFSEPQGTSIATTYLAERSEDPQPGDSGWATHAITPPQSIVPPNVLLNAGIDPRYQGDFSPDLNQGVFAAWAPLGEDPYTSQVPNLYLRTDLRSPGAGSYRLITACPLCAETQTPLAPLESTAFSFNQKPVLAGASPDHRQIAFESPQRLTADAPPQPPGCGYSGPDDSQLCRYRLYEDDEGTVWLAGRVPADPQTESSCDDAGPDPCVAADVSFAGEGAGPNHLVTRPRFVSDGSDGHTRVFFTQPTDATGHTSSQAGEAEQSQINSSFSGRLFVRTDGTSTQQLDVSERTDCAITEAGEAPKEPPACTGAPAPAPFAPATFFEASADGSRAFFKTAQPLTDDAPADGQKNIYMWSAEADAEGHHITLISRDEEPKDGFNVGIEDSLGSSADGSYFYFMGEGRLMHGVPTGSGVQLYLWHEGTLTYIAQVTGGDLAELGTELTFYQSQSRLSADGRRLLFPRIETGRCVGGFGNGSECRELYLYDAEDNSLRCVSCPSGAAPSASATITRRDTEEIGEGGSQSNGPHSARALAAGGRLVFFTSAQALVPEDTNGRQDAYVYNAETEEVHLLSSGTSPQASVFLEATPDGRNAFFSTSQPLVGWDTDSSRDVYDARVGGGFPEPASRPAPCQGESCPAPAASPPGAPPVGSTSSLAGNRCPKGTRASHRGGRLGCPRRHKHHKKHQHHHRHHHHKRSHR